MSKNLILSSTENLTMSSREIAELVEKRHVWKHKLRDKIMKYCDREIGKKNDAGKPMMDLIPPHAEMELAKVLTFGAEKYGAGENWRKVEQLERRYIAAAMRHMNAFRQGETHDAESGLHHLAHAMCCLAFVIENKAIEVNCNGH